jgi:hypothetical protein
VNPPRVLLGVVGAEGVLGAGSLILGPIGVNYPGTVGCWLWPKTPGHVRFPTAAYG